MHNNKPACSGKAAKTGRIIRIEQVQLNQHLDKVVRGTVERTLNELLSRPIVWCGPLRTHRTKGAPFIY